MRTSVPFRSSGGKPGGERERCRWCGNGKGSGKGIWFGNGKRNEPGLAAVELLWLSDTIENNSQKLIINKIIKKIIAYVLNCYKNLKVLYLNIYKYYLDCIP